MPTSEALQALLQNWTPCFIPIRPTFFPPSSGFALGRLIVIPSLPSDHCSWSRFSTLNTNSLRVRCSVREVNEMTGEVSGAGAYPLQRCKIIHLVRHGQGFHNVAGEKDRAAYMSPEFFDASLTATGWEQVRALRNHVRSNGIAGSLQLVVVSPLTRTMQTAVGAFGGEDILNGNSTETPLMADGVGMEKHKAVSSAGAPPFLAVEWCREHMGLHPCDKRQSITTYKSLFPAIDFSDVEDEEDVLWSPTERESTEQLFGRVRKFVEWILKREETDIAVVSHSGFLFQLTKGLYDDHSSSAVQKELCTQLLKRKETEMAVVSHSSFLWHLMGTFGDDCSTQVQTGLHKYFQNCEMRSIVLVDKRATEESKVASKNFLGGVPPGPDAPSDTLEA